MIAVTTITGAIEIFPTTPGESFEDANGYLSIWGGPRGVDRIALFAPGQWVLVRIVKEK